MSQDITLFMEKVKAKNPGENEFHQAVQEVVESVWPYIQKNPKYQKAKILERIVEPERVIMFRVAWVDDKVLLYLGSEARRSGYDKRVGVGELVEVLDRYLHLLGRDRVARAYRNE